MKVRTLLIVALAILSLSLFAKGGDCGDCSMGEKKAGCGEFRKMEGDHHGRGMGDHGKGHDGMKKMAMIKKMLNSEELNLSDKQKSTIEKLSLQFKKDQIDAQANMEKLHIDKREAMKNNNFSEAEKLTDQLSDAHAEMEKSKINLMKKIFDQLDDDQKAKLKELHAKSGMGHGKMDKEHCGGRK